jgi:hypothetical protein
MALVGRPKGSISRKSKSVAELCSELKFDPIRELIRLRNTIKTVIDKNGNPQKIGISHELEAKIYSDLLPYIYPRLTATQLSGDKENPLSFGLNPEIMEVVKKIIQ